MVKLEQRLWFFYEWAQRDRSTATRQAKRDEAGCPGLCVALKAALDAAERLVEVMNTNPFDWGAYEAVSKQLPRCPGGAPAPVTRAQPRKRPVAGNPRVHPDPHRERAERARALEGEGAKGAQGARCNGVAARRQAAPGVALHSAADARRAHQRPG